ISKYIGYHCQLLIPINLRLKMWNTDLLPSSLKNAQPLRSDMNVKVSYVNSRNSDKIQQQNAPIMLNQPRQFNPSSSGPYYLPPKSPPVLGASVRTDAFDDTVSNSNLMEEKMLVFTVYNVLILWSEKHTFL
ncbi:unnamed protein product, partial [Rotaria sp. Silwood2]